MSGERWQQDAGTDLLLPGLPAALLPLSERRTTAPVLLLHHPAPGAERAPLLSPVRAGRAAQVTGALIGSWKRAMREERRGKERRGGEERRGEERRPTGVRPPADQTQKEQKSAAARTSSLKHEQMWLCSPKCPEVCPGVSRCVLRCPGVSRCCAARWPGGERRSGLQVGTDPVTPPPAACHRVFIFLFPAT